jgi:hypothetical protein
MTNPNPADIHQLLEDLSRSYDATALLEVVKTEPLYHGDIALIVEFAKHSSGKSTAGMMLSLKPVLEEILMRFNHSLSKQQEVTVHKLLDN